MYVIVFMFFFLFYLKYDILVRCYNLATMGTVYSLHALVISLQVLTHSFGKTYLSLQQEWCINE